MINKFCKNCKKIWTRECLIRVWGRFGGNNINEHFIKDVNPEKDFCSRFKAKKENYNE